MRASHSGDGRRVKALVASKNRQSRQKRPSGEKVFASDNKQYHGTRHDEPGIAREPRTRGQWRLPVAHGGNFLALVAMQARFDPVLQDLLQTHPIIESILSDTI